MFILIHIWWVLDVIGACEAMRKSTLVCSAAAVCGCPACCLLHHTPLAIE
jgi:hypothetical protein